MTLDLVSILGLGVGSIINKVFSELTSWVGAGAGALVEGVGQALNATTAVSFGPAFDILYDRMRLIGLALAVPFVAAATIQAILRQDLSLLGRVVLVRVPVALLCSGIALWLVEEALKVTDSLCDTVVGSLAGSAGVFADDLGTLLSGVGSVAAGFEGLVLAVLAGFIAFALWIELAVRAAVIATGALFLPLALAGLTWPATAHWIRRLAEVLASLILSKLAMVTILVLATSTIGEPSGIGGLIEGIALLALAVFAPWALLKVVPMIEQGAISQLDGVGQRGAQALRAPVRAARDAISGAGDAGAWASQPVLAALQGSNPSGPWFDALVDGFESEIRASNQRDDQEPSSRSDSDDLR